MISFKLKNFSILDINKQRRKKESDTNIIKKL